MGRIKNLSLVLLTALFSAFSLPAFTASSGSPTPQGMLPHFESWISLGVVICAVGIACLLNHRVAKLRALGTLVSALSCFAIVVWFVLVLETGVFENPKPYQAPMDAAKPMLLWVQAGVALIVGLCLAFFAIGQSKQSDTLELSSSNEEDRYGGVSRLLHWTTAVLFIFMIPTGIFASMIPEDAWYRTEYNIVHKTIGFIIFALLLLRLVWNRRSKRPALDASLKPLERKLAHGAHKALYVLMFALPITGYVMTSLHGYPSFFFIWELQSFMPESKAYIVWGLFHKYLLQYLAYIILGAHIVGALKHRFVDKHLNSFKRMVG